MNNIMQWLSSKLSGVESKPSNSTKDILSTPQPTIEIVHPKGMSSHASFLLKHLNKMDATVEKIRPSGFSSDAVTIYITFPLTYLTGKAYEMHYSKTSELDGESRD